MQIKFTGLKTKDRDGGSDVLDEQISYIAKTFKALGDLVGRAGGLVPLRADGTIDPAFLGALVTPATLLVTATAAVNTGVTVTLPAAPGLFHYITNIELVKLYAVLGVASAAGVIVTSTNLPGNPSWTTEQAAATLGSAPRVISLNFAGNPLKSATPGVATTLIAPAQAQTIWRWNISYLTVPG